MSAFIPGRVFKNQKLYCFDNHGVTVMTTWPDMKAYRKTRTRAWRCLRPKFSIDEYMQIKELRITGADIADDSSSESLFQWGNTIPHEVSSKVSLYPNRHWHLLAFVARCGKQALELMHSTPALAWMLASSWIFKDKPVCNQFRSIRNLFNKGRSQVQILRWLDFPASKSILKILRKIDVNDIDATLLLNLKGLLDSADSLNTLRHLAVINKWNVWLLRLNQQHELCLSDRCIFTTLKPDSLHQRNKLNELLHRAIDITSSLDLKMPIMHSLGQLERYIESAYDGHLMDKYYRQKRQSVPNIVFPWFPVSLPTSFPQFELIDTRHGLIKEAQLQQHCAEEYLDAVVSGQVYFFSFVGTKRMTLSLIWNDENQAWMIHDFAGYRNAKPYESDRDIVNAWLEEVDNLTRIQIASGQSLFGFNRPGKIDYSSTFR